MVWLVDGTLVGLLLILVVFFVLNLFRRRGFGRRGVLQRSRLACSKCGKQLYYDWFPGGAVTPVRFAEPRYGSCPLCRRSSVFNIYDTMTARTPSTAGSAGPRDPPSYPG